MTADPAPAKLAFAHDGQRTAVRLLAGMAAVGLVIVGATGPAFARPRKPKPIAATAPAPIPKPREGDWRPIPPDDLLVIDTSRGRIILALAPDVAPLSVQRVQTLARQHFYDGLSFFRVIDGFMDQTGDPKNTGEGGSTLPDLKAEFTFRRGANTPFTPAVQAPGVTQGFIGSLAVTSQPDALMSLTADSKVQASGLFCAGVAGVARAGSPDSGNSQFFLMRATYPKLNLQYTTFGRVVIGQDVVNALKTGEPVEAPQDRMIQVRLASDMPTDARPAVRVLDTASPTFKATLDQKRDEIGSEFSLCDVDVPAQLTSAPTP